MTSNAELDHTLTNILGLVPKCKFYVGIDKHLIQYSQKLDVKIENITCNRLFPSIRLHPNEVKLQKLIFEFENNLVVLSKPEV